MPCGNDIPVELAGMPKPLIRKLTTGSEFHSRPAAKNTRGATQRLHTGRRSSAYLSAIRGLDATGTRGAAQLDGFVDDIRREFADRYCTVPWGIVGKCYLGENFEVHTLTIDGSIVEHYRTGQELPAGLERARTLARSEQYLAIEVYVNRLICLRPDGSVVVLESGS
jgi:hypothetical protein